MLFGIYIGKISAPLRQDQKAPQVKAAIRKRERRSGRDRRQADRDGVYVTLSTKTERRTGRDRRRGR